MSIPARSLVLALVLSASLPADALAVWGWLEKLSGPGPFKGVQAYVPFACYGVADAVWPLPAAARAIDADRTSNPDDPPRELRLNYDCLMSKAEHWALVVGVDAGRLSSTDNELPYPGIDERLKPGVNVLILVPSATLRLPRFTPDMGSVLDVGAGLGFVRFSGDGNFFDAIWKPVIQPVRVAIRPLAIFSNEVRWEFLEISLYATMIAGELTASDFGAAGPFRESNEVIPGGMVRVDVFKLFQPSARIR